MLWVFEVLVSLYFGYLLVSFMAKDRIDIFHRFFAGIPIGFFSFAWISYIVSYYTKLNEICGIISVLITILLVIPLKIVVKKQKLKSKFKFSELQLHTYIFAGIFYVFIMYLSMLRKGRFTKGAGYGDLPFHLNIISSFAHGCNTNRKSFYDINSLFYAGERLAYPFLTNFFTSVLMATGFSTLQAAMFFPSALMSLSLAYGMYHLAFLFSKNHFVSMLSLVLFVGLGGNGWIYVFKPSNGYADWIHNWGHDQYEYWFHPIMHVLVPQRASLWSMPLCYWSIIMLIYGIESLNISFFVLAAIYVGFCPLVQLHSFVGIAQWSIVFCLIQFPWKKLNEWRKYLILWFTYGIVANLMAAPQFYPYLNRLKTEKSFVSFLPIWECKIKQFGVFAPIVCWWRGLGIFAAISLVFGWASANIYQIKLYIPSMVVFLVANFVRYQPWELDNTKVFYAAWIPIALPFVSQFLNCVIRKKKISFIAVVLIIISIMSSSMHLFACLLSPTKIFSKNDISFGLWIAENTPLNSLTMSSDSHNHPVSTIAGRMMFQGYGGWLISHGLEYWKHESFRKTLCSSPYMIDEFKSNGINYMISLNNEYPEFESITHNKNWVKVFNQSGYSIWKFKYSI